MSEFERLAPNISCILDFGNDRVLEESQLILRVQGREPLVSELDATIVEGVAVSFFYYIVVFVDSIIKKLSSDLVSVQCQNYDAEDLTWAVFATELF
jgi:hypothetical protein